MPSSSKAFAASQGFGSRGGAATGRHVKVELGEAHRAKVPLASRFADQRVLGETEWPRRFATANNLDYTLEAVKVPKAPQPSLPDKGAAASLARHDNVKLGSSYQSKIPLASRFADQRVLGEKEHPRNFNTTHKNDYSIEAVQMPKQTLSQSKSTSSAVGRHDGVKMGETYRNMIPLASRFADQRELGEKEWPRQFHTTKNIDYQEQHQVAPTSRVMTKSASEKAPCQRGNVQLREDYRNMRPLASRFADQRALGETEWPKAFTSSNQMDYTVAALKKTPASAGPAQFQPPPRVSTQNKTRADRVSATASSTSSTIVRTSRQQGPRKVTTANSKSESRHRPKTAR